MFIDERVHSGNRKSLLLKERKSETDNDPSAEVDRSDLGQQLA